MLLHVPALGEVIPFLLVFVGQPARKIFVPGSSLLLSIARFIPVIIPCENPQHCYFKRSAMRQNPLGFSNPGVGATSRGYLRAVIRTWPQRKRGDRHHGTGLARKICDSANRRCPDNCVANAGFWIHMGFAGEHAHAAAKAGISYRFHIGVPALINTSSKIPSRRSHFRDWRVSRSN